MVRCSDNSLYTGYTVDDVGKRVERHNRGEGAKYTRSRLPVTLVYCEDFCDKSLALKREKEIKGWSKKRKEELCRESFLTCKKLFPHD